MQVLASNMIFLGVVIFVPFSLGRIILHYLSWFFSTASGPVLSAVAPLADTSLSLANITLKNALTAVKNMSSETQENGSIGQVAKMLKANASEMSEMSNITSASAVILKGVSIGTSRISDVTTLAIGYVFILTLIFCYFGIVSAIEAMP